MMNLLQLLEKRQAAIVAEADAALNRERLPGYRHIGDGVLLLRLGRLYALTMLSLCTRSQAPVTEYAARIARERFKSGYAATEVLTTLDVLEATIRRHIVDELEPATSAEALDLVGSILDEAREEVALVYGTLISNQGAVDRGREDIYSAKDLQTTER